MKTSPILAAIFAFLACAPVSQGADVTARVNSRGGLAFGGAEIDIVAYAPGWKRLSAKSEWISAPDIGHGRFSIANDQGTATFRGRGVWSQGEGGELHGHIEISCVAAAEMQCLAVMVNLPVDPPIGNGDGSATDFELPLSDGRVARLSFTNAIPYHSQDLRPKGGRWTVRFGASAITPRAYTPGEKMEWDMTLSAPGGLALALATPIVIAEGDDWVRLDYKKDIVPGSALDFSTLGLQDAPAGKHGWLKSVGGHFEFEGLPGVEQRFYGVNLCFSANYPDHDLADSLVDRLVRLGYNALRVHHHDGAWAAAYAHREVESQRSKVDDEASTDLSTLQPFNLSTSVDVVDDDIDRLDYLLAKCFERGIYVTTDLYVSRKAPWHDIGIDRDDTLNQNLYKTYVGVHDGAFADWCRWSREFLEHVNPYTGRAYKDEPGLPLISLINEGILAMGWDATGKATDPYIHQAWLESGGKGDTPSPGTKEFEAFDAWLTRRIFERCSDFVRSLGCRALLSNDNNGKKHGEGEGCTPLYDYVDSHWYIDHPTFIDKPWSLPSKCGNDNLIKCDKPAIFHSGWAKGASKPYTISEWNIAYPGYYRGMGGILTGALADEQEWDGLWRFAYSHDRKNLAGDHNVAGFFDCVVDPLIAASDRASVFLFLGRAPGTLSLDKARGSMAIVSPLTCGGFAESGRIDAGPVQFEILPPNQSSANPSPAPATLWVSSLDGKPVERSSRMLLVHLTDVQGEGTQFADEARRIILKWGEVPLVAVGSAEVSLSLAQDGADAPSSGTPAVYSLDTAGNRIGEVPSRIEDGTLRFTVSTRGPQGGRIYYEIVRQ